MSDLIDRQAAIEAVSTMFAPTPTQKDMVEDCLEILENLPFVQPQPIVRCKDCKHMITHEGYGYLGEPAYTCEGNMEGWVLPDSFCSHAERKDGD